MNLMNGFHVTYICHYLEMAVHSSGFCELSIGRKLYVLERTTPKISNPEGFPQRKVLKVLF